MRLHGVYSLLVLNSSHFILKQYIFPVLPEYLLLQSMRQKFVWISVFDFRNQICQLFFWQLQEFFGKYYRDNHSQFQCIYKFVIAYLGISRKSQRRR